MRESKIVKFSRRNKLFQKRWYFHVKAKNYEIIVPSEAYNSRAARDHGITSLSLIMADYAQGKATVVDLDQTVKLPSHADLGWYFKDE